jgi:hypothetical protein
MRGRNYCNACWDRRRDWCSGDAAELLPSCQVANSLPVVLTQEIPRQCSSELNLSIAVTWGCGNSICADAGIDRVGKRAGSGRRVQQDRHSQLFLLLHEGCHRIYRSSVYHIGHHVRYHRTVDEYHAVRARNTLVRLCKLWSVIAVKIDL